MKTSQKSLLSLIGTILGIAILIIAAGRIAISNADVQALTPSERYSVDSDLSGFDQVDISGSWEVELIQGDSWQVELSEPEDTRGQIRVFVADGVLNLRQNSSFKLWGSDSHPTAKVQMPELSKLDIAGASEVEFGGFEGEKLELDASGAVEITANSGRYTDLLIDGAGAVEVSFRDLVVTNADIDMSGAAELILTLDGGDLSGSISGAGSVDYYGTVSKQNIDISGAGSIEHQD